MTSTGSLPIHQLIVSTKWPPSPTKREPSSSLSRYQLSDASRPALTRYRAFVGSGDRPNRAPHLHEERSESTIESDHDPVVSGRIHRGEDAVELVRCQSQRLFHEHRLSRFERAARQVGMRTVSGDDEHGVDRSVLEDGFRIGAGIPKPNLRCALTADSERRVATWASSIARLLHEMRKQHRRGVVPGADKADPQMRAPVDGVTAVGRGDAASCCRSGVTPRTRIDPNSELEDRPHPARHTRRGSRHPAIRPSRAARRRSAHPEGERSRR